ncbi:MAG TPA: hypothetical protein VFX70_18015 [Mycobacteriales bacterium]|nr:hypothetical protein [Mycobacteriales bacterium]
MAGLVERVLSIDEVAAWKPVPAPYRLAVDRAGRPPGSRWWPCRVTR